MGCHARRTNLESGAALALEIFLDRRGARFRGRGVAVADYTIGSRGFAVASGLDMSAPSPFFVCSDCFRHVRHGEPCCPFCDGQRPASLCARRARFARRFRRAMVFAATGWGATACAAGTPEPGTAPAPPSPPADVASSSAALPAPTSASAANPAASSSATPLPAEPLSANTATHPNRFAAAYGAPPAYGPGSTAPATTAPANVADDRVVLGAVAVTGGAIDDAGDVVLGMRGAFSRCYEKSLAATPNARGEVAITIRVGLAGQVLGVAGHRSEAVPASLMACLTTNAATADFHPPTAAKTAATVAFPVTLGRR